MTIQPQQFATQSLSKISRGDDICKILAAAIRGADAGEAIKRHVSYDPDHLLIDNRAYDLNIFKRILVIGAGKASLPMAEAMTEILGNKVTTGLVITKLGYLDPTKYDRQKRIKILEACHPIPDQRNIETSTSLITLISDVHRHDLVILLLSGGGSALLMRPSPGLSLQEIQSTTALLLKSGASIEEINTIRKHLDTLKGGGLAKMLAPATVAALILSDVMGDRLDMIASGPTSADPTTFGEAWAILSKYQLVDQIPPQIRQHISCGMDGKIPETLKPGDPILGKVMNVIVGNNNDALTCSEHVAKELGFTTKIINSSLQGKAAEGGNELCESAKTLFRDPDLSVKPTCLFAGGETTVTVKGGGLGGRNQEFALGAVRALSGPDAMVLISLATDGIDGLTDAAGAVATNETYTRGLQLGLVPEEYLHKNDSYHYFEPLGDLVKTGPTSTNVNDLVFIFSL